MAEKYEVEGFKELNKALKIFPENVERRILRSMAQAGGQVVVKAARENVPVKTGKLKKGIIRRSKKGPKTAGRVEVSVGPSQDVFYGMFLEFGTSKIPATPWLRPALDENRDAIIEAMRQRGLKRIEKEAEKAAQQAGVKKLKK